MPIKISFILPGYNVEKYLAECTQSIQQQPVENIEIIIVDDFSTDGTLEVARVLAQQDRRIKIIRQAENRGSYAARNAGLAVAEGEWIVFIDPDDVLSPNYYARVQGLLSDMRCDLVVYNYAAFNDGCPYPQASAASSAQPRSKASLLGLKAFTWLKLIRRSFLKQTGIKFYEGKTMWDILFHWQITLACESPFYLDEKLVWYRQRPSASSYRVDWYRAEGFNVMDQLRATLLAENKMAEYQDCFYQEELNLYCDIRGAFFLNQVLEKRADEEIQKRITEAHWTLILNGVGLSQKKCDFLLTCCRPNSVRWSPRLILPAVRHYTYRWARVLKLKIGQQIRKRC